MPAGAPRGTQSAEVAPPAAHNPEFPDVSKLPAMGIKRVAPDRYPTACARGLDCAEDEPRYIIVKHDAIDYFRHDQSNRYYYWNESRHAFAQVGIND